MLCAHTVTFDTGVKDQREVVGSKRRDKRQESSDCRTIWHSCHQFGVYSEVILFIKTIAYKQTGNPSRAASDTQPRPRWWQVCFFETKNRTMFPEGNFLKKYLRVQVIIMFERVQAP